MERKAATRMRSDVKKLLTCTISPERVEEVYGCYVTNPNHQLYGSKRNGVMVGCLGLEQTGSYTAVIGHLAVSPNMRGEGMASSMITFIRADRGLTLLLAETDREAVGFYRKYGFSVTSLGEKYPGVERFLCTYKEG